MKWLTRLTVAAVFLLGAVAGGLLGMKLERERFLKLQRGGAAALTEQALSHISGEVKLQPAQRERLRAALDAVQPALAAAEHERRAKVVAAMDSVRRDFIDTLDAGQKARYDQLHERLKKRLGPAPGDKPATAAAAFSGR